MTSKPTVFVVDDDVSVREGLRNLLRSAGFEVETFDSALTFLDQRRPEQHGCLVLDMRMPGMTGMELQEELDDQKAREAKILAEELERKMDFVRRFRAKPNKARQAASRQKMARRIEKELDQRASGDRAAAGDPHRVLDQRAGQGERREAAS